MAQRAILTITNPFRADGATSVDITINSRLEVYSVTAGVITGCTASSSNPSEVRVGESYSFVYNASDNYYFKGIENASVGAGVSASNATVSNNGKTLTYTATITEDAVSVGRVILGAEATAYEKRYIEIPYDTGYENNFNNLTSQDIQKGTPVYFYADDNTITIEITPSDSHYQVYSVSLVDANTGTALNEGTEYIREYADDLSSCRLTIYPSCDKNIYLLAGAEKVIYSVSVVDTNGKITLVSPQTVEAGYDGNIEIIIEIADEDGSISDYGFPTDVSQSNINGATFVSFVEQ